MPTDDLKQRIISELGLADIPEPKQTELVDGVMQNVLDKLMLVIVEKLPDDAAREKFATIAEAGDAAALRQYARTQIDEFDAFVDSEIQKEIQAHKEEMEKPE
ncbi:MAG: hypothetical protein ACREGH_00695 [Minisyncoccia bacterium]